MPPVYKVRKSARARQAAREGRAKDSSTSETPTTIEGSFLASIPPQGFHNRQWSWHKLDTS